MKHTILTSHIKKKHNNLKQDMVGRYSEYCHSDLALLVDPETWEDVAMYGIISRRCDTRITRKTYLIDNLSFRVLGDFQ